MSLPLFLLFASIAIGDALSIVYFAGIWWHRRKRHLAQRRRIR